ncbi:MAG TPA: hypothetical protein VNC39_14125 [Acidocella sp.]|jgi:hypothetical protein|uniref:hypothetical protein n=1 Tax=Acidocella sp. TaxID=50710 RepID=UPI002C784077|nr:hypothetical protein [Acidocella sp.]HVE23104.1 hypothetical protein [Acidocella sp.]
MNKQTLQALTPANDSSAAIEAALGNARTAKADAQRRQEQAQERLAGDQWSLTSAQRREASDAAEDAAQDIAQVEHIAGELAERLKAARVLEQRAVAVERKADLVRRRDQHLAEFPARYAALKAQMLELIDECRVVVGDMSKYNNDVLQSFPDLVLGGVDTAAEPIVETNFWKTAEEKRQDSQRIADLNAQNQRLAEEARWQRVAELERVKIEYAQRSQSDPLAAGVYVNGILSPRGETWRR